jgi:murein DD-endopeptidase MepM/ murein hydrolase activator NlpD
MNKLTNGNFESGWYHPNGIPELQIPNGWEFGYADEGVENPYDANPWAKFLRPEVRVLPREQVPPWEQDLFILDGDHTLKPFKGGGSLFFWLTQDATLEAGKYELIVRVYPDVVMDYDTDDQKVFATDTNAALIRFNPNDRWQSINPVPSPHPGARLQTVKHKFAHGGGTRQIVVEFMLPFPLKQNGLFCDKWELRRVDAPVEPPPVSVQGSRLGTHNINAASEHGNILDILYDWKEKGGRPSIIKAVNNFGWLGAACEIFPDVPIVGRLTSPIEGCQGVENPDANLPAMAADLMQLILDQPPDILDTVSWWEPINEPDPPGEFGYAQLARLMIECMALADEYDIKLALFSLNAGTPEWSEMVEMVNTGVFQMAKAGGHILALHEGVFEDQPIDHWHGDRIPGSPVVPGAGALCFRYRYLYHLLAQRDEVIPLVVSEFRTHGASYPIGTAEVVERWDWYDWHARADDYLLGVTPFTLGARDQWWPEHDYGRDYPALIDYAVSVEDLPPVEPPPAPGRGQPREQYERTYVLLPPDGDSSLVGRINRRYFDAFRYTLGGSADDAGVGNIDRRAAVAVQSQNWGDDLGAFFERYYPGVQYLPADGDNEYQLMGRVLASLLKARGVTLAYPLTRKPPYITSEFGVDRGSYNHNGLDLRASYAASQDYILAAHGGRVVHVGYDDTEPWFGYQVKTLTALPDGQEMQIRYAHLIDDGAMVEPGETIEAGDPVGMPGNTGNSTGDHLHIDVRVGTDYADPAILIDWEDEPEMPAPALTLLGMHDDAGGDWMRDNGVQGCLLVHRAIHDTPQPIDMTRYAEAGIKVIARWGYDYGGAGTVPPSHQTAQWVSAMVHTINQSRGVYLNTIYNELNNPVEWVGGYPNPDEVLTPERALDLYERVAAGVRDDVLLAPGAVDPFNVVAQQFGQPGDPADWFNTMHNSVSRIDAIILHAKTQTNDPAECASNEKFSDAPLAGRYLHLRTYLDQLNWVEDDLRRLPVFITEVNPQRVDAHTLGWVDDNAAWVDAAVKEFERHNRTHLQPVTGICFYRYDPADPWGLMGRPAILDEIARQAKRL